VGPPSTANPASVKRPNGSRPIRIAWSVTVMCRHGGRAARRRAAQAGAGDGPRRQRDPQRGAGRGQRRRLIVGQPGRGVDQALADRHQPPPRRADEARGRRRGVHRRRTRLGERLPRPRDARARFEIRQLRAPGADRRAAAAGLARGDQRVHRRQVG
jgi:hypothetical protein